jgi:alpha-amylase/alpha-mannosidase (GH57 family)
MKRRMQVAFLWHMHQPPYEDPRSGLFLLPWTYLHGTKDYADMGEVARRNPRMRMVVNFTPSLLEGLARYAEPGEVPDQTLRVMQKDPARLSPADREYLLRTCFGVNHATMITRFPRYGQLFDLLHAGAAAGPIRDRFGPADFLDLVVLYLLVWCGPMLSQDPVVSEVAAKGRDFTEADRDALLDAGRHFLGRIVPMYRTLWDSGQVELSTTPFNHPILPLLCTTAAATEANPGTRLPWARVEAPEEAERQVDEGLDFFRRTFGRAPEGMWPAEGAVSERAVQILGSRGVKWICTDEEILRRSLGGSMTQSERLRPHSFGGVTIFFRDHFLSDQLGFVYSRWPRDKAIKAFLQELRHRAEAVDDPRSIVVVALDGENAWEHYPCGGYPFLDELYHAVSESGVAEPVTFSDYLRRHGPGEPLEQLATGSWIDGNLNTWIGDPVKNRAWSYLAETLQVARDVDSIAPDRTAEVRRLMMRAEASDWFWWFGAGHSSIHEREFDFLFRQNLRAIHEAMGLRPPEHLDRPVEPDQATVPVHAPTALVTPAITGNRDGFFKWVGAGACAFQQGSIHRLQPLVAGLRFGYDHDAFYLRVDGFKPLAELLGERDWLHLHVSHPGPATFRVRRLGEGLRVERLGDDGSGLPVEGARAAAGEVLELALPLGALRPDGGGTGTFAMEFHLVLGSAELSDERFPWDAVIDVDVDPQGVERANWIV